MIVLFGMILRNHPTAILCLQRTKFFVMNDVLKDYYKTYVSDLLRTDIFDGNNIILPEIKKSYEKFLSNANKNTEEYKSIENWYNALKKNGFRYSAIFSVFPVREK